MKSVNLNDKNANIKTSILAVHNLKQATLKKIIKIFIAFGLSYVITKYCKFFDIFRIHLVHF